VARRWSPAPVPVDILRDSGVDIYTRPPLGSRFVRNTGAASIRNTYRHEAAAPAYQGSRTTANSADHVRSVLPHVGECRSRRYTTDGHRVKLRRRHDVPVPGAERAASDKVTTQAHGLSGVEITSIRAAVTGPSRLIPVPQAELLTPSAAPTGRGAEQRR